VFVLGAILFALGIGLAVAILMIAFGGSSMIERPGLFAGIFAFIALMLIGIGGWLIRHFV
jgi:hypothetical protein